MAIVSVISLILSISKFFEYSVGYTPTEMLKNRAYQIYIFFVRGLFLLGIIPFSALIGLYAMIYRDIRENTNMKSALGWGKSPLKSRQRAFHSKYQLSFAKKES